MPVRRYKPMIARLMVVYESNYKRLVWILADKQRLEAGSESVTDDQLTRFRVKEKHRFTTFIEIYHRDQHSLPWMGQIQFLVRLSHDAKVAEVVEFQQQGRFREYYEQPNHKMFQVNEKELSNCFLHECLKYWIEAEISTAAADFSLNLQEGSLPDWQQK